MADHIATRKSTQISASTNRNVRTDRLIVNGSQQRVNVYSKPVTYEAMNNQKQAEPCVLYIRVSTTRQADKGVSLKAQKERGILHAQYQNFLLPKSHIFIERGVSAKTPLWSRPVGKQMKAFIAKHKIKQIIAYRMDRLFRNTVDCLAIVEELEKQGIAIQLCENGGMPIDLSTAMGKMMLTMLAGFGEMERNIISERTTMALQHLKDTGKRFTYDKYGWDVDEHNNFVENEEEQYSIEYMKVRHEEDGISISQIARELNTCEVTAKRGGKWSHKQVSRIINAVD